MAESPAALHRPVRGIDDLDRLVGVYCWLEQRLFEITGSWAARPAGDADDPTQRVWCAAASRRHGDLAQAWAERLPVRAGLDRAALVTAPSADLAAALDDLAAAAPAAGCRALVATVLPRLGAAYRAHLAAASPVCEAPVIEVLVRAERALAGETGDAARTVAGPPRAGDDGAPLAAAFERSFDGAGVFPAVRPS